MSIAFVNAAAAVTGSGVSSLTTIGRASATVDDLLLIVFGFEGVTGAGPWVSPGSSNPKIGPATGWERLCYQGPAASGCGLEVWGAINTATHIDTVEADFVSSQTVIAQMFAWRGAYETTPSINDGAVRAAATDQVSGDNPAAPSVYSYVGELVIVCAADKLQSPGYGTPTPAGWTQRDDQKRGSYGNVEITVADKATTVEGDTGAIPWSASSAGGTAKGATATLAVRSTLLVPGASSPLIAVEFAVAN